MSLLSAKVHSTSVSQTGPTTVSAIIPLGRAEAAVLCNVSHFSTHAAIIANYFFSQLAVGFSFAKPTVG